MPSLYLYPLVHMSNQFFFPVNVTSFPPNRSKEDCLTWHTPFFLNNDCGNDEQVNKTFWEKKLRSISSPACLSCCTYM